MKGLRLAFEEGEEAGCDQDAIDNCHRLRLSGWSVFSWLFCSPRSCRSIQNYSRFHSLVRPPNRGVKKYVKTMGRLIPFFGKTHVKTIG